MVSTTATRKRKKLTEPENVRTLLVGLRRGEVFRAESPEEPLVFEAKMPNAEASGVLLLAKDRRTGRTWTEATSLRDAPKRMANAAPLRTWRAVTEGGGEGGAEGSL